MQSFPSAAFQMYQGHNDLCIWNVFGMFCNNKPRNLEGRRLEKRAGLCLSNPMHFERRNSKALSNSM